MDAQKVYDIVVIGGGAAGFFAAINLARKGLRVIILEKFQKVLTKLAVSGGGRCNVTHHQYDPKQLIHAYPRGQKALLGPFYKFNPQDMIKWLEDAGVKLKVEEDGRMFPITDSSSTIIECFSREALKAGVVIQKGCQVKGLIIQDSICQIQTDQGPYFGNNVLIATGSNKEIWDLLKTLGHNVIEPVPSLFALNTPNSPFNTLSGLSLKEARVSFKEHHYTGPVLFTHFGLSGPAVLKLSSFAAIELNRSNYTGSLELDFCPTFSRQELEKTLFEGAQTLNQLNFGLPKRVYELLIASLSLDPHKPLNHIPKSSKWQLIEALKKSVIPIDGKTTHKQEFVTAGGVDLNQIDFTTMRSKLYPNLYFAGEVLNIDGITGGFNFQAAWTTAYLVAQNFSQITP